MRQGASSAILAANPDLACQRGRAEGQDPQARITINAKGMVASTGTVAERQGWTEPAQGMHRQDDLIGGRGPLCKPLLSHRQVQWTKEINF